MLVGEPRNRLTRWLLIDEKNRPPREVAFEEGLKSLKNGRSFLPQSLPSEVRVPFGGTKILCVGRNYKTHAKELGNQIPNEPIWFSKPPSSLVEHGGKVILPIGFGQIDYEGEIALIIGARCRNVISSRAEEYIGGVTLALDITARELQKIDGQWTRAKGFDTFCPLGPAIVPYSREWLDIEMFTELNGKRVQQDRTSSMIFPIPELVAHLSSFMTLETGDVILTGTPAGFGALKPGDCLKVGITGGSAPTLEVGVV